MLGIRRRGSDEGSLYTHPQSNPETDLVIEHVFDLLLRVSSSTFFGPKMWLHCNSDPFSTRRNLTKAICHERLARKDSMLPSEDTSKAQEESLCLPQYSYKKFQEKKHTGSVYERRYESVINRWRWCGNEWNRCMDGLIGLPSSSSGGPGIHDG